MHLFIQCISGLFLLVPCASCSLILSLRSLFLQEYCIKIKLQKENFYDKKTKICDFYLSLFEEQEDGSYIRRDESQTERCYGKEDLEAALCRAGFEVCGFFGGFDLSDPTPDCERWLVAAICKK